MGGLLSSIRVWIAVGIVALTLLPYICSFLSKRAVDQKVKLFCEWAAAKRAQAGVGKLAEVFQDVTKMQILAIANPNGGKRTALDTYHQIFEPMCKAVGVPVKLVTTTHAGHAQAIAKEAAVKSSGTLIVCLSGDGMLHDALAGLIGEKQETRLPIAVLPCGSSNGYAKSLYNSVDPFEVAEHILMGKEHSVNLLAARQIASSRKPVYDLVCVSHGVGVEGNDLSEKKLRWMNQLPLGSIIKDLTSALTLIGKQTMHRVKVKIQAVSLTEEDRKAFYTDPSDDGNAFRKKWTRCQQPPPGSEAQNEIGGVWYETDDDVFWCETVTGAWLTYDMQLAPGLKPDAGHMDIIISRGHSRWQMLTSFLKVETGGHVQDPWMERYKISQVAITPLPGPGHDFNTSGEEIAFDTALADPTVLVSCLPGHARLWCRAI